MKPVTCLIILLAAAAASAEFTPTYLPELTVKRAPGPIEIDGRLDDAGWQGAAVADGFSEHNPGDQIEPPVDTEAYITYDDEHLYVAFVCQDDPSTIRASFCPRDRIYQDDNIVVCLDTFGDAANAFEFNVNPYGIQGDLYYSANQGEDAGYDMIFHSAAAITEDGWIAELAIPFSSLRFPDTPVQTWRADFWRNRPREVRYQMSWAALDREESCWPCQWGFLHGIENVKPGSGLSVLPAVVAHQSGERVDDGFENDDAEAELSLSAKYAPSSDLLLEATLNPDFSQVESDAAQIDVNTNYALFYSEKRPFFQEGADLFDTQFEAVYTRSINDPSVAAKVTGRSGGTSYALLTARDEHSPIILPFEERSRVVLNGESWSNLLRVKHDLGGQTHLGVIATDRRYDGGGHGTLAGLDAHVRLNKTYSVEAQYLATFTEEPDDTLMTSDFNEERFDDGRRTAGFDGESFNGHALYAAFDRSGEHFDWSLSYYDRSPTFRADNGYEVANDRRSANADASYLFRFDDSEHLEYISPSVYATRYWNYAGQTKRERLYANLSFRLRHAQTSSHSQYYRGNEVFDGVSYEDLWGWHVCMHSSPSSVFSWSASANYGHKVAFRDQAVGRQTDLSYSFDLKPIDRLLVETSISYAQSRALDHNLLYFKGYVARSKTTLQLTRELSARLVIQYNDFRKTWEADPLLTYQIDPFSIFYVGSTRDYGLVSPGSMQGEEWRLTDRQYFLKLQYLFGV